MLKLKRVCSTFTIQHNFKYLVVKSDQKYFIIKCKGENCAWRVTASIPGDSAKVTIKVFISAHTCVAINRLEHAQALVIAISSKIVDKLREQLQYRLKENLQDK